MIEILTVLVFIWLLGKAIGLAFKLTWGLAKCIASVLLVLAIPALVLCLIFAGTLALLLPLALVGLAFGIVRACV